MTCTDMLRALGMAVCLVAPGVSWAEEDVVASARRLADAHLEATSDALLHGFEKAHSRRYGRYIAFAYVEDIDLGDGWRGGRGGPTVFVDAGTMSVAGILRPTQPGRPISVGDLGQRLAGNVTAYFRKAVPQFDIANYDFSIDDIGGVSYLSVTRKFRDRDLYKSDCALVVDSSTSEILGSEFRYDHVWLAPGTGRSSLPDWSSP